jgi:hypothetical protein
MNGVPIRLAVEPLSAIGVLALTFPIALAGAKGVLILILRFMSGHQAQ